jgi:hypothetical protein
MTMLNGVLRYRKRLLWMLVAMVVASALWVLNVEITYESNARHVPMQFRLRTHARPVQLESIAVDYTRSRIMAMPWPTPMHMVHRA